MGVLDIARWQFGIITVYHFLFVPLTIGLTAVIAGLETAWVRTDKEDYLRLTKFFAKVTHPRIFVKPTPTSDALAFIAELARAPGVSFLAEAEGYAGILERLVQAGRVVGPMVHDARIAALCLLHGVAELWTADRDFGRFPQLRVRNPLVD